jgi:hypothetical protein
MIRRASAKSSENPSLIAPNLKRLSGEPAFAPSKNAAGVVQNVRRSKPSHLP